MYLRIQIYMNQSHVVALNWFKKRVRKETKLQQKSEKNKKSRERAKQSATKKWSKKEDDTPKVDNLHCRSFIGTLSRNYKKR